MFKIKGGATAFDQWSVGHVLTNEHMSVGDKVSFRTVCGGLRVMYAYDDGGTVSVNAPNQLLQQSYPIIVDLHGRPGCKTIFPVNPCDKPDGYECPDTDRHHPDESGSGSSLPKGGAPHQQLVTDADGVAKWEDKPFYETFAYGSESYGTDGFNSVEVGGVYKMEDAFSISLDASKRYIVAQYPGYVCDAKTVQGMKYIGNTTILGFGEDTGEPFIVVENPDTGTAAVVLKEAPTSKSFFVHDAVKTIKPIDTKYLPSEVPAIQSAQVGQTVVVKAVDENGKPTEWECTDVIIPSSTEGSTKRFKLTVDDSGTITATEVT